MTRKSPGINSIEDLKGRCVVDDLTGHWHWKGAFTYTGHSVVASVWSPALQRTVSMAKAIGLLMGEPIPEGKLWYRKCGCGDCANPAHYRIGTRQELGRLARPSNTPLHNAKISAYRRAQSGRPVLMVAGSSIFNLGG